MNATIHLGDCREIIATLDDNSIDSIVTDPPYELGFMGKKWDASGIAYSVELWAECLRVLKPGGHLLAFGGTRTYHRLTCAIEDAGFEIRDSIHWLYGSGFPKSHDVSKGIDKQRHDRADVYRVADWLKPNVYAVGVRKVAEALKVSPTMVSQHWCSHSQTTVPTLEQVPPLLDVLGMTLEDVPGDIRTLLWELNGRKGQPGENWAKREIVGEREVPVGHAFAGPTYGGDSSLQSVNVTAPATDGAREWEGWGTALKPAHEPIVMARKPLIGTVAANVLEHGTGAINIDGCRVPGVLDGDPTKIQRQQHSSGAIVGAFGAAALVGKEIQTYKPGGRWPANLLLDDYIADTESDWSRYFYISKTSKAERNAAGPNNHPTCKPLTLMRYLVRLVTPPSGTVLEPFAGSGTTMAAAILEGFNVTGCELTAEYLPIIEGRIKWAQQQTQPDPESLFNQ